MYTEREPVKYLRYLVVIFVARVVMILVYQWLERSCQRFNQETFPVTYVI